jgi:tetratricopeptide (TPR) repeat protein
VNLESEAKQQQATIEYQAGRTAFERGQYRESVQHLLQASALINKNSPLGGEIQIWLVTAYEAAGQGQEAIALCRQLNLHLDTKIRKQSRRLLYILEAPKLNLRSEWLTQIPDLSNVADSNPQDRKGSSLGTPSDLTRSTAKPEPVELSQVNTQDNAFIWIALIAIALTLSGLLWFS